MATDGLGITTDSISSKGYVTAPKKDVLPYYMAPADLPTAIKTRYILPSKDGEYTTILAKDGTIKRGKVVKYEEQSLIDRLKGEQPKELAKVKKEQVEAFLEKIGVLGLGLKVEDVMSSNGTLNPNFKIDEKGNISFRNLKGYLNGSSPKYFETYTGEWAQAEKEPEYPSWFAIAGQKPKILYPMLELQNDKIKIDKEDSNIKLL